MSSDGCTCLVPVTIEFEAVLLDVMNTVVMTICDGDVHAADGCKRRIIGVIDLCRVSPTATGASNFDVELYCCYVTTSALCDVLGASAAWLSYAPGHDDVLYGYVEAYPDCACALAGNSSSGEGCGPETV